MRYGQVRQVRRGTVRRGLVLNGEAGEVGLGGARWGLLRQVRRGHARCGQVRSVEAGKERPGMIWYG